MDKTGKLAAGKSPSFKQIGQWPAGSRMEGCLWFFDAMVSQRRFDASRFVHLGPQTQARQDLWPGIPRRGRSPSAADADIAIWDPKKKVAISDPHGQGSLGLYAVGRAHPSRDGPVHRAATRRGPYVENNDIVAKAGSGRFLPRPGRAAQRRPLGSLPHRNSIHARTFRPSSVDEFRRSRNVNHGAFTREIAGGRHRRFDNRHDAGSKPAGLLASTSRRPRFREIGSGVFLAQQQSRSPGRIRPVPGPGAPRVPN